MFAIIIIIVVFSSLLNCFLVRYAAEATIACFPSLGVWELSRCDKLGVMSKELLCGGDVLRWCYLVVMSCGVRVVSGGVYLILVAGQRLQQVAMPRLCRVQVPEIWKRSGQRNCHCCPVR